VVALEARVVGLEWAPTEEMRRNTEIPVARGHFIQSRPRAVPAGMVVLREGSLGAEAEGETTVSLNEGGGGGEAWRLRASRVPTVKREDQEDSVEVAEPMGHRVREAAEGEVEMEDSAEAEAPVGATVGLEVEEPAAAIRAEVEDLLPEEGLISTECL